MPDGGADERLVVMLEARIKDFERNMQAAERRGTRTYEGLRDKSKSATAAMQRDMQVSTSRINSALASAGTQIGRFGMAFAGGLIGGAVAAAFAGFTSNIRGVISDIADIADAAERIGIGTREFQGLTAGMKLAGVETATTTSALEMFNQKLSEAVEGQGSLAQRLREGGISLTDNEGNLRSTLDILKDYADLVQDAPDAITRVGLATDAFGRGGKALSAALSGGREGLDGMIRDAENAGLVLDDNLVKKAAEIDDKWDILTMRIGVFFKTLAVGAAEGVVSLAEVSAGIDNIAVALEKVDRGSPFLTEQDILTLEAVGAATPEAAAQLRVLSNEVTSLADDASTLSAELLETAANLRNLGQDGAADAIFQASMDMQALVAQLREGTISTEDFLSKLLQVQGVAGEAASSVSGIDGVTLDGVIGRVAALGQTILGLVTAAGDASAAIASIGSPPSGPSDMEADARGRIMKGSPIFSPTGDVPSTGPRRPGVDSFAAASSGGGGRSGGGGGSSRIEALLNDLQTEREILDEWYTESLDLLSQATDAQLEAYGGRNEAIERLEMEHQERLRGIKNDGQNQQLTEMGDFFGAAASLTQAGGSRLNKISKALGATEALINTYIAQSQVLRDPTLGFFGKLAAYATIGAAGLNVVKSLGGGGSSGGSLRGGSTRSAQNSETETTEPTSSPVNVTIRLDSAALYSGQQFKDMTTAIQKELKARGVIFNFV